MARAVAMAAVAVLIGATAAPVAAAAPGTGTRSAATPVATVTSRGIVPAAGETGAAGATGATSERSFASAGPARDPLSSTSASRTSRVIVHWKGVVSRAGAAASTRLGPMASASGRRATFVRMTATGGAVYDLGAPLGKDAGRIVRALRHVTGTASVDPDYWMTADVTIPSDTYATALWGLLDGGAGRSPYGVDATEAWPTTTGTGVTVAVVDTGLRYDHPDLAGQGVPGYDMVSDVAISNDGDGRDPDASDPGDWCDSSGDASSWHGTHVAGTIAALANNGVGVFGGAPGVKIEPVRVLGACGGMLSDIVDGIVWAAGGTVAGVPANPTPAQVINLSLGGDGACVVDEQAAIDMARAHGALVVVAAGNGAADARNSQPADCQGVLTVAATDQAGKRADFSNYGPAVDLAAPGVGILSTVDIGTTSPAGPAYASYDGTSMATPHVALSAALVKAANPALTPDAITALLMDTATPFAADASATGCAMLGCGAGIVNATAALAAIGADPPVIGQLTVEPSAASAGAALTVRAVAVDRDTVAGAAYAVDGGAWSPMAAAGGTFGGLTETATATITAPMAEGGHAVCVRASDPASHTSDGATCATFTVDVTPPAMGPLGLAPAGVLSGQPARASSTATDRLTAIMSGQLSVDGGAWTLAPAADGAYAGQTEVPTAIVGGATALVVSEGAHTCAVTPDGRVACWGYNSDGQLGDGTTSNRAGPVLVAGISGATAVSTGDYHSCAIVAGGAVKCWGYNGDGELGNGSINSSLAPVTVSGVSGAVAIASGPFHSCAVLATGAVRCWGDNTFGQLGTTPSIAFATRPIAVSGLAGATAVTAGIGHTCALLAAGTVRCWGANNAGQLGNGTWTDRDAPTAVAGLTGVSAVSAGLSHTCALLASGGIRCWGGGADGELGNGGTGVANVPVAPSGLGAAIAVAAGGLHTCAVLADRTARCWGNNDNGELGTVLAGGATVALTPVPVNGLSGATGITSGLYHVCANLGTGAVTCWGDDSFGQLGDGSIPTVPPLSRATPAAVLGFGGRLGLGRHQVCERVSDAAGNTSAPACATLTVGAIAARFTGATIGTAVSAAIPVTLNWTSGAEAGGVATYQVLKRVGSQRWATVRLARARSRSAATTLTPGASTVFSVRSHPAGGSWSATIVSPATRATTRQNTSSLVAYGGSGWRRVSTSTAYGGSVTYSSSAGRTARTTFVGSAFAWVSTRARNRGRAEVWLDGRRVATVSLYSRSTSYRRIVWSTSFATAGEHTVVIKVLGRHAAGATGNRVDIDAFVVLAP